jgi:hypothetical protein
MRVARLLTGPLLVSSLTGCATTSPRYWVEGIANFTATAITPRGTDETGAAPVHALYCSDKPVGPMTHLPTPLLRLGEGCILSDGRSGGTCDLPTEGPRLRIVVKSVSVAYTPPRLSRSSARAIALNAVVEGVTVDGDRHVTYRFSGTAWLQEGTNRACEELASQFHAGDPLPPAPNGADAGNEVDPSSWRSGKLCTPQGCAE